MLLHEYKPFHNHEVWNAPRCFFGSEASLTTPAAAKQLGISRKTLIRYIDAYGLTVFRHPLTHNRHFLASEVQELKEVMPTITAEEVRKAKALEEKGKARGSGLLQVIRLIRR